MPDIDTSMKPTPARATYWPQYAAGEGSGTRTMHQKTYFVINITEARGRRMQAIS